MTYGDPSDEHRTTVKQIATARKRAEKNISALRTVDDDAEYLNLCRIDNTTTSSLSIEATQAIVDYLLHLRPYRHNSDRWGVDLGVVELPQRIQESTKRRGSGYDLFYCAQEPHIPLRNLSETVDALNRTILYTDNAPPQSEGSTVSKRTKSIRLPDGEYEFPFHSDAVEKYMNGEISPDEVRQAGERADSDEGRGEYRPPRVTQDSRTRKYKFVLTQDDLLHLKELADDVAEEMGVLADIEPPDHSSGSRGAV